jgi:hypothetical protein
LLLELLVHLLREKTGCITEVLFGTQLQQFNRLNDQLSNIYEYSILRGGGFRHSCQQNVVKTEFTTTDNSIFGMSYLLGLVLSYLKSLRDLLQRWWETLWGEHKNGVADFETVIEEFP